MLANVKVCVGMLKAWIHNWMGESVELCGGSTFTESNDSSWEKLGVVWS
jgi:hypothetical protein